MTLGSLKESVIPDDAYMQNIRNLCSENHSWCRVYSKHNIAVFSRLTEASDIKMFKLVATLKDVSADTLFDTLMDSEYRKLWDKNMLESYELCSINPNNDIGYYALRSFPAIRDRDFVLQRSWLQAHSEYMIANRSIFHKALPPRKQYIRAISHLTSYIIRPCSPNECELIYITQCDPRGKLPTWAVNKATQYVAPRVIKRLVKACQQYATWKRKHQPEFKPWIYPEQCKLPTINWDDILSTPDVAGDVTVDESNAMDMAENGNGNEDDTE
ncbi:START domain-containing protein 10 [Clonorchis sinensis]|uniref:START domain-containing protein 10 n=2 Tax=Clonorchis sinensis TaxID=79923 RepID=F2VT59_CLOSI|nr:phosphatidylcholine transfer protein-like protein [Clonorchis sinensis]KAG5449822.1 START domain-containing protein 10 [Clonorchis sinensis]